MVKKFRSKDNRYRLNAATSELKRLCFLYLLKNAKLTDQQRKLLLIKRNMLQFRSLNSRTRVRSGCLFTGRANFVLRHTRLSRMQFKHYASNGFLMGYSRAT
jgi:ribosomal protein S14